MPQYRRSFVPGGTFFLTVVTHSRNPILVEERSRQFLRKAFRECKSRYPFVQTAFALLPDHFHVVWSLPEGDSSFSLRIAVIKRIFTKVYLEHGGIERSVSRSQRKDRRRGVWQRRFWEHTVRGEEELADIIHYVHYNPVKHGLVACAHAWPYSTFHRYLGAGDYQEDWLCVCSGREQRPPAFEEIASVAGE